VRAPAKRRRILVFALLAKVGELGEEDEGEVGGGETVAAGFPVAKGSIAEAVGRALEAAGRAMERGLGAGTEGWRRLAEEGGNPA
jgi:nanoRNase/pAp phosphatase (c-di-AMP/oligoRNAs hydrolase)